MIKKTIKSTIIKTLNKVFRVLGLPNFPYRITSDGSYRVTSDGSYRVRAG